MILSFKNEMQQRNKNEAVSTGFDLGPIYFQEGGAHEILDGLTAEGKFYVCTHEWRPGSFGDGSVEEDSGHRPTGEAAHRYETLHGPRHSSNTKKTGSMTEYFLKKESLTAYELAAALEAIDYCRQFTEFEVVADGSDSMLIISSTSPGRWIGQEGSTIKALESACLVPIEIEGLERVLFPEIPSTEDTPFASDYQQLLDDLGEAGYRVVRDQIKEGRTWESKDFVVFPAGPNQRTEEEPALGPDLAGFLTRANQLRDDLIAWQHQQDLQDRAKRGILSGEKAREAISTMFNQNPLLYLIKPAAGEDRVPHVEEALRSNPEFVAFAREALAALSASDLYRESRNVVFLRFPPETTDLVFSLSCHRQYDEEVVANSRFKESQRILRDIGQLGYPNYYGVSDLSPFRNENEKKIYQEQLIWGHVDNQAKTWIQEGASDLRIQEEDGSERELTPEELAGIASSIQEMDRAYGFPPGRKQTAKLLCSAACHGSFSRAAFQELLEYRAEIGLPDELVLAQEKKVAEAPRIPEESDALDKIQEINKKWRRRVTTDFNLAYEDYWPGAMPGDIHKQVAGLLGVPARFALELRTHFLSRQQCHHLVVDEETEESPIDTERKLQSTVERVARASEKIQEAAGWVTEEGGDLSDLDWWEMAAEELSD